VPLNTPVRQLKVSESEGVVGRGVMADDLRKFCGTSGRYFISNFE
jgi:hypothetical protein